jgi:hypothetical protein
VGQQARLEEEELIMATEKQGAGTEMLRPLRSIRRPGFVRSAVGARFVSLLLGVVPGFGRARTGRGDRHRLTPLAFGRQALARRPVRAG